MPGRLKVWTTGQDRQYGGRRYLLDHQVQQFKGRGVRPVQVFQNKEDRLMFGKFLQDRHDSFQGLLSHALWGEVEGRRVMLR